MRIPIILMSLLLFAAAAAHAETRYIVDEAKMPVRSGAGDQYRIVRMISSGEAVELLEQAGGYAHIKMGDGRSGWILSRYLMQQPAARERLQQLQQQLDKLDAIKQQKADVEAENERLKAETDTAKKALADYQSQVAELTDDAHERWFMLGGGAILLGIVLGLILPHLRPPKRRRLGGF